MSYEKVESSFEKEIPVTVYLTHLSFIYKLAMMGISSGPMTLNFDNHSIFKIAIMRRENLFSPEQGSKVVKFGGNYSLDALIVLATD